MGGDVKKSKRLKPIIQLAEQREQLAVKQFTDAQNIQREREAKLDELLLYREEYQQKFISTESKARSVFQFKDYHAFLMKLDAIIAEQKQLVLVSEEETDAKRQVWMKKREKCQALEKAAERFLEEERGIQNKKDQKEADEHAQNRHRLTCKFDRY